jgi:hypothetical protein
MSNVDTNHLICFIYRRLLFVMMFKVCAFNYYANISTFQEKSLVWEHDYRQAWQTTTLHDSFLVITTAVSALIDNHISCF